MVPTSSMIPRISLSTISLIVGNLVPLVGVAWFGWDIFMLMILYWAESAIIGFYNVFKLGIVARRGALFFVPFFIIHYGGFMFGHLLFITALFGTTTLNGNDIDDVIFTSHNNPLLGIFRVIFPALLFLFVSHGVSFFTNFIGKGEYVRLIGAGDRATRVSSAARVMMRPYQRIILMHLTILLGGILAMTLNDSIFALAFMVILKTGMDLVAHKKEHGI